MLQGQALKLSTVLWLMQHVNLYG